MQQAPVIYVGTVGQGLWRSTDSGESFQRTSRGMFVECDVRALAADPRSPPVLYAGTSEGLYRSENAGDTWTRIESPMNDLVVWSILLLPTNPDTIIVGTRPGRLFRSTDAGQTWQQLAAQIEQECPAIIYTRITTIHADPRQPQRLWVGAEIDGVWRSDDLGDSWTRHANGLSSLDIHGLAIIPAADGSARIVATTNNDLNVSTDEGATWVPQHANERFTHGYYRGLVQHAQRPEVLFLGHGDGPPGTIGSAWRSDDVGNSWQMLPLPTVPNSTLWDYAVHPADPERIYAYSIAGQVFESLDGGRQWRKLPREFGEIRALLWRPSA